MAEYDVVDLTALEEHPWRNGRGRTRHIAAELIPPESGPADPGFRWRLSQAELQDDADFSPFPGVDRIFTVMSSGPVQLTVDGESRTVVRGEPQEFPGEADVAVSVRPGSAEKALNLMLSRGHARGEVEVFSATEPLSGDRLSPHGGDLVAVVVFDGAVTLRDGTRVRALEAILPTRTAGAAGLARALRGAQAAGAGPATVATVQVLLARAA